MKTATHRTPAPWLGEYTKVQRAAHPTKAGPGRRHAAVPHGAAPKPDKGAPAGFVQHTSPKGNARRAVKADIGARQYRKQRKALSLAARS